VWVYLVVLLAFGFILGLREALMWQCGFVGLFGHATHGLIIYIRQFSLAFFFLNGNSLEASKSLAER